MTTFTTNRGDFSPSTQDNAFAELDARYTHYVISDEDRARFGSFAIANTRLLDTPATVLAAGDVLTNPSQIETAQVVIDGEPTATEFAYFRREPTSLHLGKTTAVPYLILNDKKGKPYLSEFGDAAMLPGEDPRVMPRVTLKGPTGATHEGWAVSTVVATAKPGNPADVEGIKQIFYWGETLAMLEPVVEIPDLKNTGIFPMSLISGDRTDTRLHVFGRPHPHITYMTVPDLSHISKEAVETGKNLTEGFLPHGFHTGVNTINDVPGHPDYLSLDIHEAYAPITDAGKTLHYRLGRYGVQLSTGRLIPLHVVAHRSDFPDAEPKPPENGVADYSDVLYGSMGHSSRMVTGMSDRHVGIADIVKLPR